MNNNFMIKIILTILITIIFCLPVHSQTLNGSVQKSDNIDAYAKNIYNSIPKKINTGFITSKESKYDYFVSVFGDDNFVVTNYSYKSYFKTSNYSIYDIQKGIVLYYSDLKWKLVTIEIVDDSGINRRYSYPSGKLKGFSFNKDGVDYVCNLHGKITSYWIADKGFKPSGNNYATRKSRYLESLSEE